MAIQIEGQDVRHQIFRGNADIRAPGARCGEMEER